MAQQITFQRIEGLALFLAATVLYFFLGFHWLVYVLLLFAFDMFMVGYLFNNKVGAYVYNLGHSLIVPSIVGVIGVLTEGNILIGLSLLWFAHVGIDRSLGYGLKATTGFTHTHLGSIGKKNSYIELHGIARKS